MADQIDSRTYAADLAQVILTILPNINNKAVKVLHYSNEGVCSWYDFAKTIFAIENMAIKVTPIESSQYRTPARRPFYSVLNKKAMHETYGLYIPYWRDSLVQCLSKLKG
ncbi:sugar nucleotide-binding protein [Algibacter mikhailovii]|uniref:sugar nucleotide-binding protein n=1 Tax=Algibacter mikhailovii TaxID=425498 RepID=UPI002495354D|nr:sugar nucleotide-binding protein [Algibacter mikhailovii]